MVVSSKQEALDNLTLISLEIETEAMGGLISIPAFSKGEVWNFRRNDLTASLCHVDEFSRGLRIANCYRFDQSGAYWVSRYIAGVRERAVDTFGECPLMDKRNEFSELNNRIYDSLMIPLNFIYRKSVR